MGIDAVIGIVHLGVSFFLVVTVRRTAVAYPWLLVLAAFFAVRGVDRIASGFEPSAAFDNTADALVVATLALLVLGLRRTIDALESAHARAARRSAQYSSALVNYRRLMRHRLANPLAAVRGGVETLRSLEGLDEAERRELLDMLHEQILRLQRLSLDPRPLGPEEGPFPAVPAEVEPEDGQLNVS